MKKGKKMYKAAAVILSVCCLGICSMFPAYLRAEESADPAGEESMAEITQEEVQTLDLSALEDLDEEALAQRGIDLSSLLSAALEAGLGSLGGTGSTETSNAPASDSGEGGIGLLDILNLLGVTSRSLKDCEIKAIGDQKYTGKEIKPTPVITYQGVRLKKNTDYTVSYSNNISVGTARVTITGKGSYTGTRQTSFHIVKSTSGKTSQSSSTKAKKLTVTLSKTSYVYDGKSHSPTVKVTAGGKSVTKANYTVTYKDNKNVGKATVTVKGKGEYKGLTGEAAFKITLKKTSIRSVGKPAAGELKPAWNKDTQAEGYQLWVCTNKSFSSGVKKLTVSDGNETEISVSGLISGKKYYLKLRSYKKIGSTNWYSEWSTVKEATVS